MLSLLLLLLKTGFFRRWSGLPCWRRRWPCCGRRPCPRRGAPISNWKHRLERVWQKCNQLGSRIEKSWLARVGRFETSNPQNHNFLSEINDHFFIYHFKKAKTFKVKCCVILKNINQQLFKDWNNFQSWKIRLTSSLKYFDSNKLPLLSDQF